jgi:excisionase family DNA binding protein
MAAMTLTPDDLAPLVEELRRLRVEVERLQGGPAGELLPLPEAARRLGKSLRTVERWAKEGRIEVVPVGAARLVRLPAGAPRE